MRGNGRHGHHPHTNPLLLIKTMFAQSFPPINALMDTMGSIDYKKHFHTFMDSVEIACAFIAVIATLIAEKWVENDMTEKTQLFVLNVIDGIKTFYAWVMNVFVPNVKSFYDDCRSAYNFLRTV